MDRSLQQYNHSQAIGNAEIVTPRDESMDINTCIAGWLDEKGKLSGSTKTQKAYALTLSQFRSWLNVQGHDLDSSKKVIAPRAQVWCSMSLRTDEQGRSASITASTYNQRRSILSSFYDYAIVKEVLTDNPIIQVKRLKLGKKDAAHALTPEYVKEAMAKIDRSTPEGLRDYALLSIAFTTGHRVSELANLRLKHLRTSDNNVIVEWERCKGNKQMNNILEPSTVTALFAYLHSVYGETLASLPGDTPIWISFSDRNQGKAISTRTISNICKDRIGTSKVHTTRHTSAVRLSRKNVPLADIGRFLGHSNLKTTSDYLEEQLAYADGYAAPMLGDDFGI